LKVYFAQFGSCCIEDYGGTNPTALPRISTNPYLYEFFVVAPSRITVIETGDGCRSSTNQLPKTEKTKNNSHATTD
jgi:hypothetical protein